VSSADWYDPQTGRFLSQDPIGLAGGVNLYAYAGNNPTSYGDPYGLAPCKDANGNEIDCPEPKGGPPIPLPEVRRRDGGPARPNIWVPAGGASTPDKSGVTRGRRWVPQDPLPGGAPQPGASWDPELGHWDVDNLPGSKGRRRFDEKGAEVTHDGDPIYGPQEFPAPNANQMAKTAGAVGAGYATYVIIRTILRFVVPVTNAVPVVP
jgi:uncharacterized protein RhaS with RHS repeats